MNFATSFVNISHLQAEHFQENCMLIYYAYKLLKLLRCALRHIQITWLKSYQTKYHLTKML